MASGLLKDMWALGEPADGVDMLVGGGYRQGLSRVIGTLGR